jgi:hypothetical protein
MRFASPLEDEMSTVRSSAAGRLLSLGLIAQ